MSRVVCRLGLILYTYAHADIRVPLYLNTHTLTHVTHTHALTPSPTPGLRRRRYAARADGSRCRLWSCAFHRRLTPLHWAAHKGHAAVAAALLTHGADVESKDENA
jgi:hypothetical protein